MSHFLQGIMTFLLPQIFFPEEKTSEKWGKIPA